MWWWWVTSGGLVYLASVVCMSHLERQRRDHQIIHGILPWIRQKEDDNVIVVFRPPHAWGVSGTHPSFDKIRHRLFPDMLPTVKSESEAWNNLSEVLVPSGAVVIPPELRQERSAVWCVGNRIQRRLG